MDGKHKIEIHLQGDGAGRWTARFIHGIVYGHEQRDLTDEQLLRFVEQEMRMTVACITDNGPSKTPGSMFLPPLPDQVAAQCREWGGTDPNCEHRTLRAKIDAPAEKIGTRIRAPIPDWVASHCPECGGSNSHCEHRLLRDQLELSSRSRWSQGEEMREPR